ncbi:hypothetical protein ROTAS13_00034 [Roseomonas sp. TAS13]|nr:hypothetical protein [Sphingomonas paucimobilis]GAV32402.1 hypothetical protein ROTAS13_00034 [Roseomonas sp. TAS13]
MVPAQPNTAHDIDGEEALPFNIRDIEDGARGKDPKVVDQNIYIRDRSNQSVAAFRRTCIRYHSPHELPCLRQLFNGGL